MSNQISIARARKKYRTELREVADRLANAGWRGARLQRVDQEDGLIDYELWLETEENEYLICTFIYVDDEHPDPLTTAEGLCNAINLVLDIP